MMRSPHLKRWFAFSLIPIMGAVGPEVVLAAAQKAAPPAQATQQDSAQFVDSIAAVVNKNVITLNQVNAEVKEVQGQLKKQNIALPDAKTLQKQVLQRLIAEELQQQEATRLGIKVTDAQVKNAVQTIAQRNKLTTERLRQEIEKSGITWDTYLKGLRQEVLLDQLRQRAVDSKIVISDADVDAFLKTQGSAAASMDAAPAAPQPAPQSAPQPRQTGPEVLALAQILVKVPEGSSSAQVDELRRKAEAILAKLRGGADFASVAAASSDGPQALEGGNLGVRPVEGWPELFIKATANLSAGQTSAIVQSGNGFHILKVLNRSRPGEKPAQAAPAAAPAPASPQNAPQVQQGPMMVTQTHARHILIKISKVMNDEQAETRLKQILERLKYGEKFEDLAKRYSEDATAPQGGDLGWLTPGETVPDFERAMNALEPNQISEPVKSQFGWHIIEVLERRTKNMEKEFKRMQARQILFQRRAEPAFEDWLNHLHGQAFIDNRLDPQSNRQQR